MKCGVGWGAAAGGINSSRLKAVRLALEVRPTWLLLWGRGVYSRQCGMCRCLKHTRDVAANCTEVSGVYPPPPTPTPHDSLPRKKKKKSENSIGMLKADVAFSVRCMLYARMFLFLLLVLVMFLSFLKTKQTKTNQQQPLSTVCFRWR